MPLKKVIPLMLCCALVSGCSSREEADVKLAKGCEAGVTSLFGLEKYDRTLARVKKKSFLRCT